MLSAELEQKLQRQRDSLDEAMIEFDAKKNA